MVIYVVRPGDTLYLIARRFGTTVEAIRRENYIVDPGRIFPGQILVVPTDMDIAPPFMPPPVHRREVLYVVQRTDTLLRIARRFGSSVRAIQRRNVIRDPDLIYEGQVIIVPVIDY